MSEVITRHLSAKDPVLKTIISKIESIQTESTANVFHDLMSCIIEQQIHYRSTRKLFQKMLERAAIDQLTIHNFPTFEKKALAHSKLSNAKLKTIIRIVEFFQQNKIDWQNEDDETVRQLLSQIKGVGTFSIDMILLYTLQRENIFPVNDYHLRLIMTQVYNIDTSSRVAAQQKAIAAAWDPYRSYAVRYLLAWKEALKKETP